MGQKKLCARCAFDEKASLNGRVSNCTRESSYQAHKDHKDHKEDGLCPIPFVEHLEDELLFTRKAIEYPMS
jgi:hypothetical protein